MTDNKNSKSKLIKREDVISINHYSLCDDDEVYGDSVEEIVSELNDFGYGLMNGQVCECIAWAVVGTSYGAILNADEEEKHEAVFFQADSAEKCQALVDAEVIRRKKNR